MCPDYTERMTMNTSELTGAALDWAVAKCEENEPLKLGGAGLAYCTDWLSAGPIIEREGIALIPSWTAERPGFSADGETPLVAAMRCYVASKLGEDVEIPIEFLIARGA